MAVAFTELYAAFNARDIDAVLARFAPDVDWPNGMEGGRVRGHEAVRAYWTRQWSLVNPTVNPTVIANGGAGRVVVTVHQIVRTLSGEVLKDQHVQHLYQLRDGMIVRMDIEDGPYGEPGTPS